MESVFSAVCEIFSSDTMLPNEHTNRQGGRRLDIRAYAKCRCRGNKGRPHNILRGSIESAIPETPPPLVGANISGLYAIQADL